ELAGVFSSFQVNVPQLYADIDRTKARQLGVPLTEVFDTMQIYLGSLYANDFNRFGRTYSVRVQADAAFRSQAADVSGRAAPGYSSGQAQDAIARIAKATLPPGITFEWTETAYQEELAGNT